MRRHSVRSICGTAALLLAVSAISPARADDDFAGKEINLYVGSALVDALKQSLGADMKATQSSVKAVTDLVADLAEGVRGARRVAAE